MHVCEKCHKPATVHLTEISNGKRSEVHLCDACAQEAGYVQQAHVPINELLNQFLKAQANVPDPQVLRCPDCGLTWQEFKDTGLLGCAKDYPLFESQLQGVIERAQQGANHHTGKEPHEPVPGAGAGVAQVRAEEAVKLRRAELNRLRKELARAVEGEKYETAAKIRDQIRTLEEKSD